MKTADKFFNSVDYVSIIDNIKGIFTSDGSMAVLLDFERCLDEANLYAYKNWELGELVQGPKVNKYTVSCIFMWPYKLMPDPRGAKRLLNLDCRIKVKLTHIKVPVTVTGYEDLLPGTNYPRMSKKKVWLFFIEMPKELMDDIREGSIDLAGQNIDLSDLEDSYTDDLQKEETDEQEQPADQGMGDMGMGGPPPAMGTPPPPPGPAAGGL